MPAGDDRSQAGRAGRAAASYRGGPHRTRARSAMPSQRPHEMLPVLVDHRRATARPLTGREPRASTLTDPSPMRTRTYGELRLKGPVDDARESARKPALYGNVAGGRPCLLRSVLYTPPGEDSPPGAPYRTPSPPRSSPAQNPRFGAAPAAMRAGPAAVQIGGSRASCSS
jgi:hypothetical protein